MKRRIKALKQLQLKTTHIEAQFYEEVHALECRYYQLCAPHYQERSNIISGIHEPTDEECVWESEEDEEITNELKDKVKIEVKNDADAKKDENGYLHVLAIIFILICTSSIFAYLNKSFFTVMRMRRAFQISG